MEIEPNAPDQKQPNLIPLNQSRDHCCFCRLQLVWHSRVWGKDDQLLKLKVHLPELGGHDEIMKKNVPKVRWRDIRTLSSQ